MSNSLKEESAKPGNDATECPNNLPADYLAALTTPNLPFKHEICDSLGPKAHSEWKGEPFKGSAPGSVVTTIHHKGHACVDGIKLELNDLVETS